MYVSVVWPEFHENRSSIDGAHPSRGHCPHFSEATFICAGWKVWTVAMAERTNLKKSERALPGVEKMIQYIWTEQQTPLGKPAAEHNK